MVDEILLVGNPNTGKSTLFNKLTNSAVHTGNWHGVTVDSTGKEYVYCNKKFKVIDLPGVYSLSPLSFEEKVTVNYLLVHNNSPIINILDVNNLNRNLYLTLELLLLKIPMMLVINKTSKIHNLSSAGIKKLSQILGIDVFLVDANNKADVLKLKEKIFNNSFKISQKNISKIDLTEIIKIIHNNLKNITINKDFVALKVLEKDEFVLNKLNLNNIQLKELETISNNLNIDKIAKQNYDVISNILSDIKYSNTKVYGKSRIDKIVLNKYFCLPIFFLVLLAVFYITFFSVGSYLGNTLGSFIQNIFGSWLLNIVKGITSSTVIYDFFASGVLGGIGTVFSFLPQVVILFVCLGILEDSGYLSRVAFSLDDVFKRVGLSGKSVYTLLMGFGCSTTACMTARTMEDKNSKIKTAMLAPYMSCTAKLPIYVVIGSAFFGASNVFVIFSLYMLGVIIALLLSVFYEKTFLKSEKQSFIMEFPEYRLVGIRRICTIALKNIKSFLLRVGSLLVSVNIIVWILSNFSFNLQYIAISGRASILETLGKILSPIFAPLGFNNWGAVSALLAGLIAKEVIVSSIAIINGISESDGLLAISRSLRNPASVILFTPASSISFMAFCLLYSPCLATSSMLIKEIGKKWTLISIIIQFAIAYAVSFVLYQCINTIMNNGIILLLIYCLIFVIVGIAISFVISKLKSKKCNNGCTRCV